MNEFKGKINTLVFNEEELDNQFRAFLSTLLAEDKCYDIFSNDIDLQPLDSEIKGDTYFPCVTLNVIKRENDKSSQDSAQMQNRTRFVTELNIYTSGENKRLNSKKLAYILEQELQEQFGLNFDFDEEVTSEVDDVCRRLMRATNVIENSTGIIYNY